MRLPRRLCVARLAVRSGAIRNTSHHGARSETESAVRLDSVYQFVDRKRVGTKRPTVGIGRQNVSAACRNQVVGAVFVGVNVTRLLRPSPLSWSIVHTFCDPAECVADKGYHSRAVLRALNDSPWKIRIAAPKQTGFSRWHGDEAARRAVINNRARLKSGVAREAFKLRAEIVERCFAHNLDRGGMR